MSDDHLAVTDALLSARPYTKPFPHAVIERLVPEDTFVHLAETWPAALLYPVPAERLSTQPRRRHFWLNDPSALVEVGEAWRSLTRFLKSPATTQLLIDLAFQKTRLPGCDVRSMLRLCEEIIPYRLERHLDSREKVAALVWYVDGGPNRELGTTLYGDGLSKTVKSSKNSAILIPNSKVSFHGGHWLTPENYVRRTLQLFLVNDEDRELSWGGSC